MNKKEQLYYFIKSLTPAEKRYFKLSVSLKDKNYLKLFDFIEKQSKFDDSEIKEEFAGEKFINQLHVTKNYLNKLILKSLRNYYGDISVEATLRDMLKDVEILFKKELYDQCIAVVNRVIEKSDKYEKYPQLLNAYEWKRKILLRTKTPHAVHEDHNTIIGESLDVVKKIERENKYWYLTFDTFGLFTGKYDNPKEFLENELIAEGSNAESLRSKILFYHLRHTLHLRNGDYVEAEKEIDKLIDLLETKPERIKDDPSSYLTALNNKITMLLSARKRKEIPDLLTKIRTVTTKYGLDERNKITGRIILRTYNIELEMYRDEKEYSKGFELIPAIKNEVKKYETFLTPDYSVLLYYQFAYFSFMVGKYSVALDWINEFLNEEQGTTREDLQSYARFMSLIIHYELNNVFVLRYSVESVRRFLKKKRELNNWEKALLKFFSRVSTSLKEKHSELFRKLNVELFAKTSKQVKANVLDYFDFEEWMKNHTST